ncbi:MAG TPA: hypothetical protein VGX68_08655 [Thermoanaerobaculia bacterium]|jgi:hypothetical protein|nr:hypothetical protein [Thermoanaerobaculia bacterium]
MRPDRVAAVTALCLLVASAAAAQPPAPAAEPADLVVLNGKVLTVDPASRVAEAVAVRGGVIVLVGTRLREGRFPSRAELDAAAEEIRAMATIVGGEVVYPPRSIMRSRAWMQTISARK